MTEKIGRNDPCPCGSGKKYKQCCFAKTASGKKKFSAKPLTTTKAQPQPVDLMERTFGAAIAKTHAPQTPDEKSSQE